jgi:hypothetical protein
MAAYRGYRAIPANEGWGFLARGIVNRMMRGKLNVGGEVTLTPGAASTLVLDDQICSSSVIVLAPMSASAANAILSTWLSAPETGRILVNHAIGAETDRTFRYIVMG